MSLEAIVEDNEGVIIQTDKAGGSSEDIGRVVREASNPYKGIKAFEAAEAIEFIRLYDLSFEQTGLLAKYRNFLSQKEIKPIEPKGYISHSDLPWRVRAFSSPSVENMNKKGKLEYIGIPADYRERLDMDMKALGFSEKQMMLYYILHERTHLALKHDSGYKSEYDFINKEGEIAGLLFKHFREESKHPSQESFYNPLMQLAALEYVVYANKKADFNDRSMLNSKTYLDALSALGLNLN